MTIAVSAGNDCWRYYDGGILKSSDNCPTDNDHAVTIVAFVEGNRSNMLGMRTCRYVRTWYEYWYQYCEGEDETMEYADGQTYGRKYMCCRGSDDNDDNDDGDDDGGNREGGYWVVQNSWGT